MDLPPGAQRHRWDLSPAEARRIQKALAGHVREGPMNGPPGLIAGVDVSVKGSSCRAAIVVLEQPGQALKDVAVVEQAVGWPYVPGLLAFREIPPILAAWKKLTLCPDVIMIDGHGRAHPKRFGLACHLGVLLQIPTLGVAKRRYVGQFGVPGLEKGSMSDLTDPKTGEMLGAVVRTRTKVSPVFVSTGHNVSLDEVIALTLQCAVRFRLPEPTRQAHLESRRWGEW